MKKIIILILLFSIFGCNLEEKRQEYREERRRNYDARIECEGAHNMYYGDSYDISYNKESGGHIGILEFRDDEHKLITIINPVCIIEWY